MINIQIFSLLGTNQATEFNEPLEPLLSIHAEEEDQVFVYLYIVKISMRYTTVFALCETTIVQRSAAKYFCLARCGPLYTFLLFRLQPRAKTITDNDQPPFLRHQAVCANSSTKVTSVCISMYKLWLYPESSCLV